MVEEPKARTRRKTFHYVLEDSVLRHISKYSIRSVRSGDERAWTVEYYAPEERLMNKWIYEFTFTNSGGFIIWKYRASEFLKDPKDRKFCKVKIEELRKMQFEVKSKEVKNLLKEGREYYYIMINEIKNFIEKMNITFTSSERVLDFYEDWKRGEAACLCYNLEEARQRSLEQTFKLIHQWWTLKIIHEALNVEKIVKGWFAEQGKPWPTSIFIGRRGVYYTCWFEPQIVKKAPKGYEGPLTSFFEGKYVWKRPDLLIAEGRFNHLLM